MFNVPDRLPTAAGVKVTLMLQLAPGASDAGQLLFCEKSPVTVIAARLSAAVPVLVRLIGWEALLVFTTWLAKVSDCGENATCGATPVPLRAMLNGVPLNETVKRPVRVPVALGLKEMA